MRFETKRFNRTTARPGRLREDEFCAGIPPSNAVELDHCHRRFVHVDSDGDGRVMLEEIAAFYRAILRAADDIGDDKVSFEEFLAVTQE